MKVAITGSSGLIGAALVRALRDEGGTVLRLVRRTPAGADEVCWDPFGEVDTAGLEGLDAVVHLAGAGLGNRRWSETYKQEVRESRVEGTRTLARALASLQAPPRVLVAGSATGYYGDTGDSEVDESAGPGHGFLADLVRDWEAATEPAAAAGIRVVHARAGMVLAREGGLLGRLLPLFRAGLGGRAGSGRQWMSWIALPDQIAALRLLMAGGPAGPVNLVAPEPVTNAAYTKAVGASLRRPTVMVAPEFALRLALGEFADEGVLVSQRVRPTRLLEAGYRFRYPELGEALRALV